MFIDIVPSRNIAQWSAGPPCEQKFTHLWIWVDKYCSLVLEIEALWLSQTLQYGWCAMSCPLTRGSYEPGESPHGPMREQGFIASVELAPSCFLYEGSPLMLLLLCLWVGQVDLWRYRRQKGGGGMGRTTWSSIWTFQPHFKRDAIRQSKLGI